MQKNRIENRAVEQMKKWQRSSGPGRNDLGTLAVKTFANTSGMHPPAHIQTHNQILVYFSLKIASLSLATHSVGYGLFFGFGGGLGFFGFLFGLGFLLVLWGFFFAGQNITSQSL